MPLDTPGTKLNMRCSRCQVVQWRGRPRAHTWPFRFLMKTFRTLVMRIGTPSLRVSALSPFCTCQPTAALVSAGVLGKLQVSVGALDLLKQVVQSLAPLGSIPSSRNPPTFQPVPQALDTRLWGIRSVWDPLQRHCGVPSPTSSGSCITPMTSKIRC
jgi:hypothetical protein